MTGIGGSGSGGVRGASLCLLNLCSKIWETALSVAKTFCPVLDTTSKLCTRFFRLLRNIPGNSPARCSADRVCCTAARTARRPSRHVLLARFSSRFLKALDVLLHFFPLRIGHEDDAVDAAQHELAGGVVNDLAGDGVELELGLEPLDDYRVEREEIEEQRAIRCGRQRDEVAAILPD